MIDRKNQMKKEEIEDMTEKATKQDGTLNSKIERFLVQIPLKGSIKFCESTSLQSTK